MQEMRLNMPNPSKGTGYIDSIYKLVELTKEGWILDAVQMAPNFEGPVLTIIKLKKD